MGFPHEGQDRRGFLGLAAKGALAGLLFELLPDGGPISFAFGQDRGTQADVNVVGVMRGPVYGNEEHQRAIDEQVRKVLAATFDLEVIKPGHTVLIKVAANSPYKYPMVAHPMVVRSVVRIAKARGARVMIVDQPGFEHVLVTGDSEMSRKLRDKFGDRLSGYTNGLEVHKDNGLWQVAVDEGIPIEAGDNETDYEQVDGVAEGLRHWPARKFGKRQQAAGFRVNKRAMEAVRSPDTHHVISISRPAAHVQAGHTGPTKTWYGWIYTADRLWSHLDLRRIKDGDPFDSHDHVKFYNPLTWFGRTEVARLHECIADAAMWFERRLPIRAHVLGAIDHFVDVGPDWAKVAMKRPNVIASAKTALQLDLLHAAMLAEEKSLTPHDERRRQALENMPSVAAHADTPVWRRQLETPLFYGIEHPFHDLHGTHWWDDIVDALNKGDADRSQGGIYALRQVAESLRQAGKNPESPPPVRIEAVDGDRDLISDRLEHLIDQPTPATRGIIRSLPAGQKKKD